ncbi:GDP-L-fucose synthase family protein [Janthinobacterium sp. GB4P2]|uniref:GDP-L-fucose synthase family protein n=1 Tax=Janthinobacterium sp. GB4P2 TaxID=3424189 RepID=UPI003F25D86C
MRILITGGSGMVGSNFREHVAVKSHELLFPSSQDLNLFSYEQTEKFIREAQPDLIIHAAGRVGGIQANMREPVRFLTENLDMGRNVILAARAAGVKRLINIGSSCMYPRNLDVPLSEDMILTGELEPTNEGYAIAKITVSRLCDYITRENPEYQYKTVIPCNLYGRHDKFDPRWSHLIPAILHKVHAAKLLGQTMVEIWGDGTARREFMYAGDLADALYNAADNFDTLPGTVNIGLGTDYSVNDYYAIAAEVVGYEGEFVYDLSKPVGMKRKLTSIALANTWGWSAKTSLREGLALTYEFYLNTEKK